ncbi:MAG: hypothetical protein RL172_2964 [Bacteroidota bacterium]|jgi:starch-binding outer membrane protein SusE/F
MKSILKSIMAIILLGTTLAACEKDEQKVFFEGGTAPVLTASSTNELLLNKANENSTAIIFYWTNPNYQFNTGLSSQDVTYTLQIDTAGSDFKNPNIQEISVANELRNIMTVKDLNTALTKLGLTENLPYNVQFRVKTSLGSIAAAPLYSNVLPIKITIYLDVAIAVPATGELYITGDAVPSSWTNNPPIAQKLNKISNTEYNITMAFESGKYYKFLTNLGQWQPQYGLKPGSGGDASGGDLGLNPGNTSDPDAIPTPGASGTYKVTLNFKTGKYKAEKL